MSKNENPQRRYSRKVRKLLWWEKEWDRVFKDKLSEIAIEAGWQSLTFNDYAKQQIDMIVQKEIRQMCETHNMIAIATEHNGEPNKRHVEKIQKIIKDFEDTKNESERFIKKLKRLL